MAPRRASKVDSNQAELVATMRAMGMGVYCSHAARDGFPDLVVWRPWCTALVEVKAPTGGRFTPAQVHFWSHYEGPGGVVDTFDDVLVLAHTFDTADWVGFRQRTVEPYLERSHG